jgi:hypothetical protein
VIGRQTLQAGGSWELNWSGRPVVNISSPDRRTLNFQNVNVDDITTRLTIRIASVNGQDVETAARNRILQIQPITRNEVARNDRFRFIKGELQGFTNNAARDAEIVIRNIRRGNSIIGTINRVSELIIPDTIWGDPVISIGNGAFRNIGITNLTIPESVRSINEMAFGDNNEITSISIGENVVLGVNSFRIQVRSSDGTIYYRDHFRNFYIQSDRKMGTYFMGSMNRWIAPGDDAEVTRTARRQNIQLWALIGGTLGVLAIALLWDRSEM